MTIDTASGVTHEDSDAEPADAAGAPDTSPSAWHVVVGGSVAAIIGISAYGSGDPDLFWHRVLGDVWWRTHNVRLPHPDPIAYTSGQGEWRPTAWAVELLYDRLHAAFGYDGIAALRLVLTTVIALTLVRYLSTRLPPMRSGLVLLLIGVPLALDIQDRPQTFSFLLTALMLPAVHRWYESRRLPARCRSPASPGSGPTSTGSGYWSPCSSDSRCSATSATRTAGRAPR